MKSRVVVKFLQSFIRVLDFNSSGLVWSIKPLSAERNYFECFELNINL